MATAIDAWSGQFSRTIVLPQLIWIGAGYAAAGFRRPGSKAIADPAACGRAPSASRSMESRMKAEPKLIGLFGMFGTGNIGNDGSLESMLRFLRTVAPQQPLLCICGNPAVVEAAFGIDAVPIYPGARRAAAGRTMLLRRAAGRASLWLHAARHLRRVQALIIPGMGVLDDFSVSPLGLGWPHDVLSWCLLGRLMGVKVIFASVGAGPIRHPISRWLMKAAARAAHWRSYRDTVSKAFMASIGFDVRNDPIYPDIAFRLPAPAVTRPQDEPERPLVVGVGVMAYSGWRNDANRGAAIYATYLEKMTTFVASLLDRGHLVRVLMGDQADRRAVDDLFRAVRVRRPEIAGQSIVFAPAFTLHDIMEQMAGTDVVVATRYHNVVCALRIGKPTISIGYSEKNDALLAEMGLAEYCQSIEQLDVARLEEQTLQLITDRLDLEDQVRRVGAHFQQRLREQEDLLASMIFGEAAAIESVDPLDARDPVI
jgi:polysaccharide pyruvyl transferase WcaK-like protein